jgi:protein-S-isoprenylcysteine O-methyltransferase Ste14
VEVKRSEHDWRWGNFPIPQAHVSLIAAGVLLNALWPLTFELGGPWLIAVGIALALIGVVLMVWATAAAGRVKLADPEGLVTVGPYGMSRHPMYLAWTLLYLGLMAILSAGWLLILLPILAVWVHWDSGREEQRMVETFGSAYEDYRSRVRRYV